jgi:hypothetical protein
LPIGSSCCVQRYQKVPPFFPGKSIGPVGSDHDGYYRDHHTTIIKREEPREHTTIIKKERRLRSDKKVIIYDDD